MKFTTKSIINPKLYNIIYPVGTFINSNLPIIQAMYESIL